MKVPILIMLAAVVVCTASAALAVVDPYAPTWRGAEGSTFQEWNFSTAANPAAAESVNNLYGDPSADINVDPMLGTGWNDTMPEVYGSAQGWWDIGTGSIVLTIPNRPNAGEGSWKDIQLQVVYWLDINDAPDVLISPSATSANHTSALLEEGPMGGAWYLDLWTLRLEPNPDSETITLVGSQDWGSQIDRITVDTICTQIPEPSSLVALLSLVVPGALAIRRRRSQ